jgi:hypothetical protein
MPTARTILPRLFTNPVRERKIMAQIVNKTVNLQLVGLDGNAFSLMGAFQRQAARENWTDAEIKAVLDECMSGNYEHLLYTLAQHCEPTTDIDDDEE